MPIVGSTIRPLVIVAALGLSLAVAGCSTPTPAGGTGGDGGSGGTSGRPGTSQDDGSTDGADESANEGAGAGGQPPTGRLPADWPADVVVPDGDIVNAMGMGDAGWVALVDVADPQAAFLESSASLQAAGYTVISEVISDNGSVGIYENAERQVQVAVPNAPEAGWSMSYTITRN